VCAREREERATSLFACFLFVNVVGCRQSAREREIEQKETVKETRLRLLAPPENDHQSVRVRGKDGVDLDLRG